MKIFRLSGGLGNQFFSYAACYQYAKEHNEPIVLDTSTQEAQWFFRNFDLAHYSIKIDKKICYRLGDAWYDHLLLNHIFRRLAIGIFTPTIKEDKTCFHADYFEQIPDNCYLIGDWQYLGYIDHYPDDIRKLFTYKDQLSEGAKKSLKIIEHTECSVAIHARRGDIAQMGGALGEAYFLKAIEEMVKLLNGVKPTFFCFSEDTNWLRKVLSDKKEQYDFIYMDYPSDEKGLEDFELMRKCHHQIIANSTYSWWAAYLNDNPNKVVIYSYNNKQNYWPEGWYPVEG